ncbi:MAG: hypothetical protein IJK64_02475 [Clostridia bacterium]|nr:hypothetical protein [Clostridia bacterium]
MISIVFCGDLRYCPYLLRYTDRLDAAGADYEVLFWNRAALSLALPANYHYYNKPSPESLGKAKKMLDFLGFRAWVKKQLRRSNPDGVIFLSTLSAMFVPELAKKYKGNYIFDIRDYSYESISAFRKIETRLIENSYFTSISSKGFRAFLPDYDYVIAHNFNRNERTEAFTFRRQSQPYQIVWNGTIRYFDYQKDYLDAFANDPRFELIFHGEGTDLERYKTYCASHGIRNVCFTGAYDNKDKAQLVRDAAVLNNCYSVDFGDEVLYAVSNRFYDGLVFHIPQIVEAGTFKAQESARLGVGLTVDAVKDLPDRLFDYYNHLHAEAFDRACDAALEEIIAEDDTFIRRIDQFIEHVKG